MNHAQKINNYARRLTNIYSLVRGTSRNNSPYLISDEKKGFYQDILNAIDNNQEPELLSLQYNDNTNKKKQIRNAIKQLRDELNEEDKQIVREIAEPIASYVHEIQTQEVPFPNIEYNSNQNPLKRKRGNRYYNNNNNNNNNNNITNFHDPPTNNQLAIMKNEIGKLSPNSQEGGKKRAKKTQRKAHRKQRKTQRKRR